MALSKDKKKQIVEEVATILTDSKLIVMARYPGTSVKAMQELRSQAGAGGTSVKVIKNRLFKKALSSNVVFKDVDTSAIEGQLLYAFNSEDEVAPAQDLANFAKSQPQLQFVGGLTADGRLLSVQDVQEIASLPSKQQLLSQLTATLAAPLSSFSAVLSANIRGVLHVLKAQAEQSK